VVIVVVVIVVVPGAHWQAGRGRRSSGALAVPPRTNRRPRPL